MLVARRIIRRLSRASPPYPSAKIKKIRLTTTPPTPLNLFMNVKINEEGGIVFRGANERGRGPCCF